MSCARDPLARGIRDTSGSCASCARNHSVNAFFAFSAILGLLNNLHASATSPLLFIGDSFCLPHHITGRSVRVENWVIGSVWGVGIHVLRGTVRKRWKKEGEVCQ